MAVVAPADDPVAETPASPPPALGHTAPRSEHARHSWGQLIEWMENDPQTLSAKRAPDWRDPFMTPETEIVQAQPEAVPEQVKPEVSPKSLGMSVSSTIVGPGRRVAQIDGRAYREGGTIKLVRDGQEIEFTLAEVEPHSVTLTREGKEFRLHTHRPTRSGRIELVERTD